MKTLILTSFTTLFLCIAGGTAARTVQSNPPDSLEILEKMVNSLSIDKAENIPVGYIQLDLIRERLNRLSREDSPGDRGVQSERNTRLNRVVRKFDSISPLIIASMARIDLALYEDGLATLREHDSAAAARLFEMSLNYNKAFAPSAYSLISLYNTPEQAEKAAALFDRHMKDVSALENDYYRNLFQVLAGQVLDSLLRQARRLGAMNLPFDAVQLVATADSFAQRHSIAEAADRISETQTAVHRAMYESYLRIADKAMQNRKQELAASYYTRAGAYLNTHAAMAGSDKRWEEGLAAASKPPPAEPAVKPKKKKGRHRTARATTIPARKTPAATQASVQAATDTMLSYHLTQSALAAAEGNYAVAIRHCDTAAMPHSAVAATADTLLCSCYRRAARRPLLDSIRGAWFTAWKNQLREAERVLEDATAKLKPWCLENDTEIQTALASLQQRIREKTCDNVQAAFETEVYRAIAQCMAGNYLHGNDHLEKATALFSGNPSCIRSDSLLRLTEQKYRPSIAWQQEWTRARQSLERKRYREFPGHYTKARELAETNNLPFKETFSSLLNFVKASADTALLAACILLLTEQEETAACWELIQYAATRQQLKNLPFGVQTAVGKLLAATDRKSGNTYWLDQLKKGGRTFSVIKKAYLSGAKQYRDEP